MALGRKASKEELLKEMRGEDAHKREECGCFDDEFSFRADLFKKGMLWLEKNKGEDVVLRAINERDDELNRRWCEDDLATFRDWWRDVVREAAC